MSHATAALARDGRGWAGHEVDLDGLEDLDGVVEELREVAGDDADPVLLFVEENDEWFAVVRLDRDGEPRVFVSDGRVLETSEIAAVFAEAAVDGAAADDVEETEDVADPEDDDEPAALADGEPVGDPGVLADLGTSASRLLGLCDAEGQLPSDIISALCEAAGCLDELERLRGE